MVELKQIVVKKAFELPEETQKALGAFGDTLVEVRLSTNLPLLEPEFIVLPGRFSTRLHELLDQDGLLIN